MKTAVTFVRLLSVSALFAAAASFVHAGPGAQAWQTAKPVSTFTAAKAVGADDLVTMQCKDCKTVMIRDAKHVGPASKGRDEWFAIGSKHTCDECKGEITVVKGKTEDSMQHNCSKCGEASVTCCAAMAVPAKP